MNFTPLSDEEIKSQQQSYQDIFIPGKYWFTVKNGNDAVSKSSNKQMFVVELIIHFSDIHSLVIKDYLLEDPIWKLSSFCKSINEEGSYKNGKITNELVENKQGFCEVDYQINTKDNKKYLRIKKYLQPPTNNREVNLLLDPFDDKLNF